MKVTITYHGVELECEGVYTRGRPGTMYKRSGDPGDPPEDAEFELEAVRVGGVDIGEMLEDMSTMFDYGNGKVRYYDVISDIADSCINAIENMEPREKEDY